MAKLYFRYGTVSSAKTLNLLAVAHNYETQGRTAVVVKPRVDTRHGETQVVSRAGLGRPAHIVVDDDTVLDAGAFEGCACVLVDEAQFLSAAVVSQLRELTRTQDVPVICYGLRTDFRSHLFEGSRRLMELADSIEEVKTTCGYCNRKATMNLKLDGERATVEGPSLHIGGDSLYRAVCYRHYVQQIGHPPD